MTYTSTPPKLQPSDKQAQPFCLPETSSSNMAMESAILATQQQADWSHATQDLLDALPQLWTRGLLYSLIIFSAIALPWACLSKVEETGTARGRLEPQDTPFKVDAPVTGTVAQVLVEEGETVTAQQPLLEVDSRQIHSELEQTRTQLEGQKDRLVQLELLKNQLQLAVRTQEQQNQAQHLEKQTQIEQVRQELNTNQSNYEIVSRQLERDAAEVERFQPLAQAGAIAEIEVIEIERIVEESHQRLAETEAAIHQAELRLTEQQNSYQSLVHSGNLAVLKSQEQLRELETQLSGLRTEISQSNNQIYALEQTLDQYTIRAPINGIVFDLPIKQPGPVVQPSTFLAEIAPENAPLILRAQIATPDTGELITGMLVKLKFDAFPFKDYGIVEGRLTKIAPTSKLAQTPQGEIASFDVEIELNQTCIQIEATCIDLLPGQTATAEIVIRERRIVDFILDPFRQLQQGGLAL